MVQLERRPRPAAVVAYLRAHGWQVADDGYEGGALWERIDDEGTSEAFVPMAEDALDYGFELARLIHTLSSLQQRDVPSVLREIEEGVADVIEFRVASGHSDRWTLGLAARMFQAAHDMTMWAADAVQRGLPQTGGTDFSPHVEVDAAGHGSYAVRVLCPFTHVPDPKLQRAKLRPLGRRVTEHLDHALGTVVQTARLAITRGDLAVFETAEEPVSPTLCGVLAAVQDPHAPTSLDIRLRWAPLRGHSRVGQVRHSFGPDTLELLRVATR